MSDSYNSFPTYNPYAFLYQQQQGYQPSAADAAAARMRRAVQPPGGRPDSGLADTIGRMLVPGLGSAMDLAGGNYGSAAQDAALSAIPYAPGVRALAKPALALGAGALGMTTGSTTATDAAEKKAMGNEWGKFGPPPSDMLPSEIAAYRAAIHTPTAGSVDKVMDDYKKRIAGQNAAQLQSQALDAFHKELNDNGEFKKLTGPIQEKIRQAPDAEMGRGILGEELTKYANQNQPFGVRHPDIMEDLQYGSAGLGAALPFVFHLRTGGAAKNALADAQAAFDSTLGSGAKSKVTQGALNNVTDKRNALQPFASAPWGKYLGGTALDASIPAVAGVVVPNALDMATSQPGSDLRNTAFSQLTDPQAYARAGAEGLGAALFGHALGYGTRYGIWGPQMPAAKQLINTIDQAPRPALTTATQKAANGGGRAMSADQAGQIVSAAQRRDARLEQMYEQSKALAQKGSRRKKANGSAPPPSND